MGKNGAKLNQNLRTVIVVDDEPELLEFYTFLFGGEFNVMAFSSPKSFLEALDSRDLGPIAFVISDYMMPEMNGIELIRSLGRKSLNVPVLMITGYLDKNVALAAVNNNCHRILEKPASPIDIRTAAKDLLKEQELISTQKRILEISEQLKELYLLYRDIVTSTPSGASPNSTGPESPLALITRLETELDFLIEKSESLAA